MEVKDVNKVEGAYANMPVPNNERRHWFGIAAIFFGMTASLSAFVSGGALVANQTFSQAVISIILATFLLVFLFYIPTGLIGSREGLNTYLIGEAALGAKGSNIATAFIITIVPCVGWYGIQVSIAAEALNQAVGGSESLMPWLMIALGVIFAIPAMRGVTGMAWLDYISIPIILVIVGFGFYKTMSITGIEGVFAYRPDENYSILWGTNIIIGSLVVGCSFVADYTRWTKNKVSYVTLSGIVGIFPPMLVLTVIGSMMALTATTLGVDEPWNIALVLSALGMPSIALLLVIILQWTTNITSAYSSGLALHKVFGWSRFWWTLIAALVGTLLAISGIIDHFLAFLNFLAVFVSPAAGVIISEYFLVSKGKLKRKKGIYWPGIFSWLIGGLSAYFIPFFLGAINGLVISVAVYYVYHYFINSNKPRGKEVIDATSQ